MRYANIDRVVGCSCFYRWLRNVFVHEITKQIENCFIIICRRSLCIHCVHAQVGLAFVQVIHTKIIKVQSFAGLYGWLLLDIERKILVQTHIY